MRSRHAGRWAAVALAVGLLGAPAGTAPLDAAERGAITITEGAGVDRKYPGFTVANPDVTGSYDPIHPERCRSAAYCDVMELTVTAPVLGSDEFMARLELHWPPGQRRGVDGAVYFDDSDLDMFLWDSADDTEPALQARGVVNPEGIDLALGDRETRRYLLVVSNSLGTTPEYTIKGRTSRSTYGPPPEDHSDRVPRPPSGGAAPTAPGGPPEGSGPGSGPADPGTALSSEAGLGPVPMQGDLAFGRSADGPSAVDIAAEQAARSNRRAPRPRPVPGEPSSAALLAWLVVMPITVVVGARIFIGRRRGARVGVA